LASLISILGSSLRLFIKYLPDLIDFQVSLRQLQQWATLKDNMPSFESSAKDGINVEQAFQAAARKAIAQEAATDQYQDFPDQIRLKSQADENKDGCGC